MNFNDALDNKQIRRDGLRTRFAPSPTGRLHIGGARTALLSWLVSKGANGGRDSDFLVRIEDTDRKRYVEGSEEEILAGLKFLGIDDSVTRHAVTGEPLVYRQSDNLDKYIASIMSTWWYGSSAFPYHTQEIDILNGHEDYTYFYVCTMTPEIQKIIAEKDKNPLEFQRLVDDYMDNLRYMRKNDLLYEIPRKYRARELFAHEPATVAQAFISGLRSGRYCRPWVANGFQCIDAFVLANMTSRRNHGFDLNIQKFFAGVDKRNLEISGGNIYGNIVLRLATPIHGSISWMDKNSEMSMKNAGAAWDFVALKNDKRPTYFLAAAYDDHQSLIDVVIRGNEWQSSTPSYYHSRKKLHDELSDIWMPNIWHIPIILSPTGKGKLSKRNLPGDLQNKVFLGDLITQGYPAEAIRSWLLSSCINMDNSRPYIPTDELVQGFSRTMISNQNQMINYNLLDRISKIVMSNHNPAEFINNVRQFAPNNIRERLALVESLDSRARNSIIRFIVSRSKTYQDAGNYLDFVNNPVPNYSKSLDRKVVDIVAANLKRRKLIRNTNFNKLSENIASDLDMDKRVVLNIIRGMLTASPITLPVKMAVKVLSDNQLSRNIELCL